MKRIKKGKEPKSLTRKRNDIKRESRPVKSQDYEDFKKNELRQSLYQEQGGLCCYCNRRIKINDDGTHNTKIEHFLPRTSYEDKSLDYSNLMLACEGRLGSETCCDTKKREEEIPEELFPASPTKNCENYLSFKPSGKLEASEERLQKPLEKNLALNHANLLSSRREAWARFKQSLERHWGKEKAWRGKVLSATLLEKLQRSAHPRFILFKLEKCGVLFQK